MNSSFLKACRGEPADCTPVWLNRQAGRYMPEYHALKGATPSLEFFTTPDLAARAALDAQRILGTDAAIMFGDLLPMLVPMGLDLNYAPDIGPVINNPLRSAADVSRLATPPALEGTGYIADTIKQILDGLPPQTPLIGFAGAPFTLASYAVEGRSSRHYLHVKRLMYEHSTVWDALMTKLVDAVGDYVRLQIDSGVHAVQIFDSWVGCLSVADYDRYVKPHTTRLMASIGGRVPVIYFGTGNCHLVDAHVRDRTGFARPRLAHVAGRDLGPARHVGGAGQHGPDRALRRSQDRGGACAAGARRSPRTSGTHLQPRPRHPSADARGQREVPDRLCSRAIGAGLRRRPRG